ncbi:CRP/FNR family transcriptional regulator [Rhodobium orientis]|uniref:Crp/Fnr family transcriptional regulator n=1 Tax=Rhodobium orientis TaxID=34017 RepID=A0A327JIG5_9HYPH|nr:Crp/Fnr family transcriptional regulator [Rhodobium orientis]MBB4303807.1 CRP/FNR family transcriptional regulator [Rhodobium orientis]MBK5947925.1 hypothetical protein [Rhodobium orientis]RAI26089.1 hypothetical protein CH339_15620 [Rhodobium orientis]
MSEAMQPAGDWVAAFPALVQLDAPARAALSAAGQRMTLPPGAEVFAPGDPCRAWLLVESGSVRVQMTSDTGREVVLYRVGPTESCILTTACLLGEELYSATGIVETETVGIAVGVGAFRRLLEDSAGFRDLVFAGFGRRFTDILMRLEDVAFHRLDIRLARLLLARAADGSVDATHQDIAVELGSVREVVSRQLKTLERDGLIQLDRGRIEIRDPAGLQRIAAAG